MEIIERLVDFAEKAVLPLRCRDRYPSYSPALHADGRPTEEKGSMLPLFASLTSSMSEGSTFAPVFRLRMDMVDLRGERLMSKSLEIRLSLTAVYDTVLWM